ncbi:MAG: hypothetical protein ACUVSK_11870 [Desulfotomaculales bacterium]
MLLFSRRRKRRLIRPRPLAQGPADVMQAAEKTQAVTRSAAQSAKRAAGTAWATAMSLVYMLETVLYYAFLAGMFLLAYVAAGFAAAQAGYHLPYHAEAVQLINNIIIKIKEVF